MRLASPRLRPWAADSGKPITIGYSTYTVSNPAFAGIIQGMKEEAEKFGYKFIVANSNNSATQQIADVDSLITQGANYIIITPADGAAIEAGGRQRHAARAYRS